MCGASLMIEWPSSRLHDLLEGRVAWGDAPPSIQSWAQFTIYQVADSILKMPKEKRRSAIDKAPEDIRPMIEAEIMRLWSYWRARRSQQDVS